LELLPPAPFSNFGQESGRLPKLLGKNVTVSFEPCMVEPQYAYRWKENLTAQRHPPTNGKIQNILQTVLGLFHHNQREVKYGDNRPYGMETSNEWFAITLPEPRIARPFYELNHVCVERKCVFMSWNIGAEMSRAEIENK
jgi:hypothetical protein